MLQPFSICTICGGAEARSLYEAGGFDDPAERFELVQCRQCGIVSTSPLGGEVEVGKYYSPDYYGGKRAKFIAPVEYLTYLGNRMRADMILSHADLSKTSQEGKPPRVLDIGCGRGHFLAVMAGRGWECHGVEREDFSDVLPPGIDLHLARDDEIPLDSASFDVITIWHVLEHLPRPLDTLREARRLLRPGGLLAVAVPNFGSWQADWLAGHWPHLDLPRHLYHFTPETLEMTLGKAGLGVVFRGGGAFEQDLFGFIQGMTNRLGLPENGLFHQLKGRPGTSRAALPLWALATGLLLPPALLESAAGRLAGRGASLILFATPRQ